MSPLAIIPLNAPFQENRAYMAMVGIVGLWAVAVAGLYERSRLGKTSIRWGILAVTGLCVILYSAATVQRNGVWQDAMSLWSDAVQKNPLSVMARDNLGVTYRRIGMYDLAADQFREALRLEPRRLVAVYNMGLIAYEQNRDDEAERWFLRTLQLEPRFYKAHLSLGYLYQREGRAGDAIREYSRVRKLNPELTSMVQGLLKGVGMKGHGQKP
jgi:tetratricopeptide (TPR) repeat protein